MDVDDSDVLNGLNERAAGLYGRIALRDGTSLAAIDLLVGHDSTTWTAGTSGLRRVDRSSITDITPVRRSRRSTILKGAAVGAVLVGTVFALSFGEFFIVPTTLGATLGGVGGALWKRRSMPGAATITLAGADPIRADHLTLGPDSASWAETRLGRRAVATSSLSRVDLPRRLSVRPILFGAGIGAVVLGGAAYIGLVREDTGYEAYALLPAGVGALLGGTVGALARGPRRVYLFNRVEPDPTRTPGDNKP
ncbi:MAG: hypothetical protein R2834_02395 [Rhodothermales bacterium]